MSCKVQQSVCSDCVTYVKSRIKFNTFNTFNNVKRDEAIAYKESLKSMTKGELIKNSMSLKRRIDKLSDICDVEDTYRAIIEQGQAERKAEKLEKEMSCVSETIKKELIRRKVHFEHWFSATQLTNILIDSINQ